MKKVHRAKSMELKSINITPQLILEREGVAPCEAFKLFELFEPFKRLRKEGAT